MTALVDCVSYNNLPYVGDANIIRQVCIFLHARPA